MIVRGLENGIKLRHGFIKIKGIDFKKYDYVYAGSEFCENLLEIYTDRINFLKKLDNKICFLTPPVTDKGINYLVKIFKKLKESFKKSQLEITVNDFGSINVVRDVFKKDVVVNIGRHLTKHFFSTDKTSLRVYSVDSIRFINSLNIERFEISSFNTFPSDNLECLKKAKLRFVFSFFYPYVNLTMARNCLIGMHDNNPFSSIKTVMCSKECIYSDYFIDNKETGASFISSENSVFVENISEVFLNHKIFKKLKIDRAVYSPYP